MMTTKLYQIDTYLKEWDARILAAKPAPEVPGGSAKQPAGGSAKQPAGGSAKQPAGESADASLQTCYLIQLDQTAFFPEGGGQGADHGKLRLIGSDSEAVFSVIDVQEDGDLIWHTVCLPDPADGSSEPTGELCTILSEGCKVHCILDWDRRFEHMQRHCGEHILSGAFYRLFGGANHGFHMGQDYMTIDIALEDQSPVTPEMARQAELLANQVIWDDLPVSVSYFDTRQEAEQLPLRKALAFDEAISIVTIGELSETSDTEPADCVACCGTHPSTTGQVGLIKIYKVEKYKDMTRIYCDAGRKALTDYQRKHEILTNEANRYSASVEEFPEKLRIQEEKMNAVRNELYHLKKAYIKAEKEKLDAVLGDIDQSGSKTPVILYPLLHLSMDDAFTMAKSYMGNIRAGKTHPLLLLYVPAQTSCVLVSDGTVHCGKLVKEYASFYQGKGGGNDVSARAIFTSDEDARLFADLLSKHLK